MAKTLGGTLFIRNGVKFDYCFEEALRCLIELCDQVVIVDAGSSDETIDRLYKYQSDSVSLICLSDNEWQSLDHIGKERLSVFTNKAIENLKTDYVFNLQGDEIIDPKSYSWIRKAIEEGEEGYLCKRINLWGSPYTQLNVPHNRKPCSTEILRLAKTCYRAYDDAESLAAPCSDKYVDLIKIWHMGFVRKREVHPAKIREMQGNIFKCGVDSKLEGMEVFDSTKWFGPEDLIPIEGELPPLIQQWAKERE